MTAGAGSLLNDLVTCGSMCPAAQTLQQQATDYDESTLSAARYLEAKIHRHGTRGVGECVAAACRLPLEQHNLHTRPVS